MFHYFTDPKSVLKSYFSLSLLLILFTVPSIAQSVSVGAGSYSTSLPSGEIGPQNFQGQNILPKVSSGFQQRVQTNDFWSSLIFPFFGNPHSGKLIAHPLAMQAKNTGLELSYTSQHVLATAAPGTDYLYPYVGQMIVGVSGLDAPEATTYSYSDWTVTAEWIDGNKTMYATLGHGLPFCIFRD